MAPLISGTDFLAISTRDAEKARDFYANVLGLEQGKQWGSMPGYEFETGNLTIAVMQSEAFGLDFHANTHPLEFHVDDFDAAYEELSSRGVEFRGDTIDSGVCKQAFFQDPDGNMLAIHHRYAEGAPPAAS
jgi:catechol 2,3-dioxygenase-like lactoylglutathione lyase family enzyme